MHKIIALWAHPRSMSTAMERAMRERGDLTCLHEPFMYYYYVEHGRRHFAGFDVQPDHPTGFDEIRDMVLDKAEHGPVFFKDMAYYVMPRLMEDPDFAARITHCLLVRHPLASILSYHKLDPGMCREEIGIEALWQLCQALEAAGHAPVVLEAETVRASTRSVMARLWERIGLDWREDAFDWGRETPKDWAQVSAWHEDVSTASGIRAADAEEMLRKELEFEALVEEVPHLRDYLRHHLPFYEQLADRALVP